MTKLFLAAAIASAVILSAAKAETQTERQACQSDAFKFCWSAIPDPHSVFLCLAKKHSQLSDACREVMANYTARSHPHRGQWASDLRGQAPQPDSDDDAHNAFK